MDQMLREIASVLFVGHSLISPTLPTMMDDLLEAEVHYQIINGAPLESAWKDSRKAEGEDGRALLRKTPVDVLVLTERVPLDPTLRWHDPARYAGRWVDLAVKANPQTQTYLYETWHNIDSGTGREIPWDDKGHLPWRERLDLDLPVWEAIVDDVNRPRAGKAPPMRLIPAGQGMARLYDALAEGTVPGATRIQDFFSDDIHPNDLGMYYVAMIHYATITGQPAEGLPRRLTDAHGGTFQTPSPELAAMLQRLADETVAAYRTHAETRGTD